MRKKLNGKDFFETLKKLDIDTGKITAESLDWIFDNKETSAVVTWLCTYVNESNIENNNKLQDNESFLTNSYNCKENVSAFYSNNIETNSLKIKQEIEDAKFKEKRTETLISKYLVLESKINDELGIAQEDERNAQLKKQIYINECKSKTKQLEELHKTIYKNAEQMTKILLTANLQEENTFFCQMPLENYLHSWESLNTNFNLWIRKNLEVINQTTNNNITNVDYIESEIERMKFALEESMINFVNNECAEQEMIAKLNYLRNNSFSMITDNQATQSIQLTARINTLYEEFNKIITCDLQQIAEKYSSNLIRTVCINFAENKLSNRRRSLQMLKTINNELTNTLSQFLLIFLLLKADKTKIQSIDKFLEDAYFYSSSYIKQNALNLEMINEVNSIVKTQKSIETFSAEEKTNLFENTIKNFQKENNQVETLENKCFVTNGQKYWDSIKKIEQTIITTKDIVFCGPTTQAIVIPYEFLYNSVFTELYLNKVNENIVSVMHNQKAIMSKIENNRWLKHKRILWQLFLVKPQKLDKIIQELKDYVTQKAKE